MNINSINTNNDLSNSMDNSQNNTVKRLKKQAERLQDEILSINESKLDIQTKRARINELQQQIEQINVQIQQIQMENLKKKTEKGQNQNTPNGDNPDNQNTSSMTALVKADNLYSQAKSIKNIKKSMEGTKNVLKMEIKLDAGRAGGETSGKTRQLGKVNERISSLEISYSTKLKSALSLADKTSNDGDKDSSVSLHQKKQSNEPELKETEKPDGIDSPQKDNKLEQKNKTIDILI